MKFLVFLSFLIVGHVEGIGIIKNITNIINESQDPVVTITENEAIFIIWVQTNQTLADWEIFGAVYDSSGAYLIIPTFRVTNDINGIKFVGYE